MLTSNTFTFLLGASIASLSFTTTHASPVTHGRAVTELNKEATEEAHKRDGGATRAFEGVEIKTSDGKCLFVDPLSGDFRSNLTPIQVAACDGSQGQAWDIISKGVHNNNEAGKVLIVNTLTQACLDLNKGRVGKVVTAFSCGGRADGSGETSRDQLFTVSEGSFPLTTDAADGTCLAVQGTQILPAICLPGTTSQSFTIGQGGANSPAETSVPVSSSIVITAPTGIVELPVSEPPCSETTLRTLTRTPTLTVTLPPPTEAASASQVVPDTSAVELPISSVSSSTTVAAPIATTTPAGVAPPSQANPTEAVPVSRAGGTLNPTLAAEAHTRDNNAVRAATSVSIRSQSGQCLSIDPTAGDFRQNLIPISVVPCTGSPNEKFDLITSGVHNNKAGKTLVVSSLMNGCVNFDSRRAVSDTVMVFSCGGRAAGEGGTTDDQLFDFAGGNKITLAQTKGEGDAKVTTCLVPNAATGRLDSTRNCGGNVALYSIV